MLRKKFRMKKQSDKYDKKIIKKYLNTKKNFEK